MRSVFKHLVAPVFAVSGTSSILLPLAYAQEETKEEKKTTAIIVRAEGNQQADIQKKVAEALEKAGVADEMKAKILKEVAVAEEKARQAAKKGELSAKKAEAAEKMAKDAEVQIIELHGGEPGDVVELNVTGEGGVQQRLKQLRARSARYGGSKIPYRSRLPFGNGRRRLHNRETRRPRRAGCRKCIS